MDVQIAGKKIEIGGALQERISLGLEERVSKYFDRTGEAFVTVSKPGWAFNVDCSIHLPSGVTLQAHGEGDDPYAALDQLLDKIEKRVRRYKSRLRNHRAKDPLPSRSAPSGSFLSPSGDDDDDDSGVGDAPAIVAESDTSIRTMTVSMAVMQLELAEIPALMFRNAAHGGLNMVFRRADGNVGWVDPPSDG